MPATGLSRGAPSSAGDPRLAFEAVQMALDEIAPTGGAIACCSMRRCAA